MEWKTRKEEATTNANGTEGGEYLSIMDSFVNPNTFIVYFTGGNGSTSKKTSAG